MKSLSKDCETCTLPQSSTAEAQGSCQQECWLLTESIFLVHFRSNIVIVLFCFLTLSFDDWETFKGMLLPSLFWPRCLPWCVTTCTELLWTITTELATPRCDFLLYCIKGSLWFSIYSATYLSLRYLHRQIFNILFCPQNLSTVSSDDVICISSFLFRIFLRILGQIYSKVDLFTRS